MDQLKKQLAVVMEYSFWIGSAIVLLGSVGVWYLTTSNLNQEHESQVRKLNSDHETVTQVRNGLFEQPNDLSHAEMDKLIDKRKGEVLESWKTLYDRQRPILTWPTEELTDDFIKEFEGLIPIEKYVEFPTLDADEKTPYLRTQYQRYIKNAMPRIAQICRAEWSAEFSRTATVGLSMNLGAAYGQKTALDISGVPIQPLVKWAEDSQQDLLTGLFPWRTQGTPPTTLEVYYSQENLWILKQLLGIIDEVNGDATQRYQAKIHEIVDIRIGSKVRMGAGEISKPGEGMSSVAMGMAMDDEMMSMGMESTDLSSSAIEVAAVDPGDNRYVNTENEPITGSQLRSALTSNSSSDAEIAVAKRVPVMMSVKIDQRYVQDLLAACGSAALMVEVSQVRLLPKSGVSSGGGIGGMSMEAMMEGEEEAGGGGMEGLMAGGGQMNALGPATKKRKDEFPLDQAVEIYGLIYIYNPPNPEALGVEEVDKNTVIEDVVDATGEPVVEPAAPANTEDALPAPAPAGSPDDAAPADGAPADDPTNGAPADPPAADGAPADAPPAADESAAPVADASPAVPTPAIAAP